MRDPCLAYIETDPPQALWWFRSADPAPGRRATPSLIIPRAARVALVEYKRPRAGGHQKGDAKLIFTTVGIPPRLDFPLSASATLPILIALSAMCVECPVTNGESLSASKPTALQWRNATFDQIAATRLTPFASSERLYARALLHRRVLN